MAVLLLTTSDAPAQVPNPDLMREQHAWRRCIGLAPAASDQERVASCTWLIERSGGGALAVKPLTARGHARLEQCDLAGARADLDQAIRLFPRSADALLARGGLRQATGDLSGAMADIDAAIDARPNAAAGYSNRGNLRRRLGDVAGAAADHDKAVRLAPNVAAVYQNRGQLRRDQGDRAGAMADFGEAMRLDPHARRRACAAGRPPPRAG
ncbi:tetratricopeptide repeat protein [Dankookia sp. P2]|uniref:tetratricopeptide repeat protein n=1 Tax=Dankookia sp. P2 TaxID=3423955 RepID=UPI003D66C76C